jgi:hypothetical protein
VADDKLARVLHEMVDDLKEPLGVDRWSVKVETGTYEDPAACLAQPEYKQAALYFDPDKLETGDDPAELATHEITHCHTAAIHDVAIHLAHCVAECAPESMREPLRKKLQEEVRWAAEYTTTRVAFTYIRLVRRWRKAEADLASAKAELKALRKAAS